MMAQQDVDSLFRAARAHHHAGRLADAEPLYRSVLARAPQHAEALHLLGMLSYQQGRHAQAIELVRAALRLRGYDAEMHHDLGNVEEAHGDLEAAAASYRRTLDQVPGHADAHYNLAGVLAKQGRIDEAIASYRAAIAAAPGQADAHNNLGTLYYAQGRFDESAACYRTACQRDPRSPVHPFNLGNTLYAAGRPQEAALCYRDALALRPDFPAAHNNLGNVLYELGHPDLALSSYRRALARADDPTVGVNFARALRHAAAITHDDAELRALATRALTVPWGRPGELERAAGALLAAHPAIGPILARFDGAGSDGPISRAERHALAQEPLFIAMLTQAPVSEPRLERLVTALRRSLLDEDFCDLALACAVARQCFVNEYAFAQGADELARVADAPDDESVGRLVATAAYRPLDTLPGAGRLLDRAWPEPVRALLSQQIAEPQEERALRDALPAITPIADPVSRRVQAQYEENPYPRWIDLPPATAPLTFDAWLRRQLPVASIGAPLPTGTVEILIAGCGTGQEAIETAERHADARVLAVDLSRASLAYAQRKARARKIANLTLAQADLARLPALGRRFDVVSAVGVLHHLADPLEGWRALSACVAPGGLMQIGLYSEAARGDVARARAFVTERGDAPTAEGIRHARAAILADPARFGRLTDARDFYSTSECRDLLFHVQEQSFTLPRLCAALDALRLTLLGFVLDPAVLHAYRQAHPGDATATDLEGWEAFERTHPGTFLGMYQFWARKA